MMMLHGCVECGRAMRHHRAPKDAALAVYGSNGRCSACANRLRRSLVNGLRRPVMPRPLVALTADERVVLAFVGATIPGPDGGRVLAMLGISSERVNA